MRRGALEIVATHLKFDACEAARVALKSPQTLPSGDVPHHQLAVTAGTDDTVPPCKPTALTGPSWPSNVRCISSVSRFHTRIKASFELTEILANKEETKAPRLTS